MKVDMIDVECSAYEYRVAAGDDGRGGKIDLAEADAASPPAKPVEEPYYARRHLRPLFL